MSSPAKAKPRRRRHHDTDQARFVLRPQDGKSDLDREVQEHVEQTRREPLPGQAELPLAAQRAQTTNPRGNDGNGQ